MRGEGRHVLLLIDNFSGHFIQYQPTNVQIEFFEPNLTSFIQPLDAGIIRCVKAHYRGKFCQRAIDLDEAGEREIFKINLIEGMITVLFRPNVQSCVMAKKSAHPECFSFEFSDFF
jgi:hypothetical protein